MIPKIRRAYSAPAAYLTGGGELRGMDALAPPSAPPERAALAENLWRAEDGKIVKRKGIRLKERLSVEGRIEWMRFFAGQRFTFYINKEGEGVLRLGLYSLERKCGDYACPLEMGDKLFILCQKEWLVVTKDKMFVITPDGYADISDSFGKKATPFTIDNDAVTVPLISAGGSPSNKGQGVLPPNLLTPIVKESFTYRQDDKEVKRNRFPLSLKPVIRGVLPDKEENPVERRAVLAASARVEMRLESKDDYGNTVDGWTEYDWTMYDHINADAAAFWVQDIHSMPLCYDGEDNVRITYFRQALPDTEKLLSSVCCSLYGVGGLPDRIFAAAENRLFYSAIDDGLYFGQLQYLSFDEPILLLSAAQGVLTLFGADTAWRVEGQAEKNLGQYALDAFFSITGRFPIPHPYSKNCVSWGQEMLFYSERGVTAIHPGGVLDERTASERSQFLWGLLKEESPENIRMALWDKWLVLTGQKGMYLFDLTRREKSGSGQAFEGYFWSNVGAESFYISDGKLCFFRQGNLYTFAESGTKDDYHDEFLKNTQIQSVPIRAVWESVLLGQTEHCGTYFGLLIRTGAPTVMRIWCTDPIGRWHKLYDYDGFFRGFCYENLQYAGFAYGVTSAMRRRKIRLSHRRGIRLRFENDIFDSNFTLERFAVEYK